MKTIDEYMKLPYRMEIISDTEEGGYVVSFPELKGYLTCVEKIEDAVECGLDAKKEWLQAAISNDYPIPDPDESENYSGQFKLRIPKTLHKQLVIQAKREGISMNQYCVYLLSQNAAIANR